MQEQRVRCKVCGKAMQLEERSKAEWGRRRYRYTCPNCGAHGGRGFSAADAYRCMQREKGKRPESQLTHSEILCPYHKRHSYKNRSLTCESCFAEGYVTTTAFADKKHMLKHMQMYCRKTPGQCPIAIECAKKYG